MYPFNQPPNPQQGRYGYPFMQQQDQYGNPQANQQIYPQMTNQFSGQEMPQYAQFGSQTGGQYGFPNQQVAQSTGFQPQAAVQTQQSGGPAQIAYQGNPATSATIPNKRLTFITTEDQANFAQLFLASVTPGEQALSGDIARQVLLRSNLSNATLGDIWQLADTQKSGKLMFPEFCLAMYLCSRCLRGEPVPYQLDSRIQKEVTDMVDEISFSVVEPGSNNNNNNSNNNGNVQQFAQLRNQQSGLQQPQSIGIQLPLLTGTQLPQQTGIQLPQNTAFPLSQQIGALSQSASIPMQQTGGFIGMQSQPTGPFQSQPGTALQPQTTGGYGGFNAAQAQPSDAFQVQPPTPLQHHLTGPLLSQSTGGFPSILQSQQTGPLQTQVTGGFAGLAPLQAMPTGKPGQWGFSNATTPGLDTFQTAFTPQATSSQVLNMQQQLQQAQRTLGNSNQNTQSGKGMSKQEKQTYDKIFNDWDKNQAGVIDGATAISIFGKSGLENKDLEAIWNLCDRQNRGKLDRDEFSVAMHLIYCKLNGQSIPVRLPLELIPPSQQRLDESVEKMKRFLKEAKYLSDLEPKTGGSTNNHNAKYSASVFKNDDNDLGAYKSASRHRSTGKQTSAHVSSSYIGALNDNGRSSSISDLARKLKEKQNLLKETEASGRNLEKSGNDSENEREIADLKQRIRKVQSQLTKQGPSDDRYSLTQKLELLIGELPQLMAKIRSLELEISESKITLMQRRFLKENPNVKLTGTGPQGKITDADRAAAKRKADLRAKMAALTGNKSAQQDSDAFEKFDQELTATKQQVETDKNNNEQSLRALEGSLYSLEKDLREQLDSNTDPTAEKERTKWEDAIGVDPEVRTFILELPKASIPADEPRSAASISSLSSTSVSSTIAPVAAKNETVAERIARIRAEAQRRTQEKFAKAGITFKQRSKVSGNESRMSAPSSNSESPSSSSPVNSNSPTKVSPTTISHQPDDIEDEEEKQLKAELEASKKRIAEQEALAKSKLDAREKRKAELLAQRNQLNEKLKETSEDHDEWDDDQPTQSQVWKPQTHYSKSTIAASSQEKVTPKVESTVKRPSWMPTKVESTPFQQPSVQTQPQPQNLQKPSSVTTQNSTTPVTRSAPVVAQPPTTAPKSTFNPFSRPGPESAPKGTNDDGWSDDGSEADEDDNEPRDGATAKQLASLLFGTMGSQRPSEVKQENKNTNAPTMPLAAASGQSNASDTSLAQRRTSDAIDSSSALTTTAIDSHSAAFIPQDHSYQQPSLPGSGQKDELQLLQGSGTEHSKEQRRGISQPSSFPSTSVPSSPSNFYEESMQQPSQSKNYQDHVPNSFQEQQDQHPQEMEYDERQFSHPVGVPPPPPTSAPPSVLEALNRHSSSTEDDSFEFSDAYSSFPSNFAAPPAAPPATPGIAPPAVPVSAPPAPPVAPPAPPLAPPMAPPMAPSMAPPSVPGSLPIAEDSQNHTAVAPPPLPASAAPQLDSPLQPPPPPPPPSFSSAPTNTSAAPAGGLGNALLGEISSGGFKLKKVDKSQQKISESNLGRVI